MAGLLTDYLDNPEKYERAAAARSVLKRKREQQAAATAAITAEQIEACLDVLCSILGDRLERALKNPEHSETTRQTYAAHCRRFAAWCREAGVSSADPEPEIIAAYLIEIGGGTEGKSSFYRYAVQARTALAEAWRAGREPCPFDDVVVTETLAWIKDRHNEAMAEGTAHNSVPPDITGDPPTDAEH